MNSKYEVKKLGDYIVQVRGISYKPTDISEEPIDTHMAVLRANSIKNNKLILEDLIYVNKDLVKENQIIKENDILIAASSGSKEIVGKSVQIKDNTNFTFGAFCKIVRCSEKIEPRYVGYFLRTPYYRSTISNLVCGANINNLKNEHIDELLIPMPSREIQQKIVNILDKSQELIDKRKEQIEALDELVKSKFIEMFGELKTNENNFDIVDLESLTTKITDGVHSKPEYTSEGVEFISVKDINKGKLNFDECKYISQEAHERYIKRCRPEIGDVLYTKVGATYGIPAVVDTEREFSLYVSVALLKLKKDIVNPIYIKEALRSVDVKRQADRQVKGIGVPDLHLIEIKKFKVFNPPIELQNQFADFVKQVDKLKFKMEKSLKKLEDNFNSLMQKAFKGELFN